MQLTIRDSLTFVASRAQAQDRCGSDRHGEEHLTSSGAGE